MLCFRYITINEDEWSLYTLHYEKLSLTVAAMTKFTKRLASRVLAMTRIHVSLKCWMKKANASTTLFFKAHMQIVLWQYLNQLWSKYLWMTNRRKYYNDQWIVLCRGYVVVCTELHLSLYCSVNVNNSFNEELNRSFVYRWSQIIFWAFSVKWMYRYDCVQNGKDVDKLFR